MSDNRRIRFLLRTTKKNNNKHVLRFGFCFGYWPCLRSPYLQLSIGIYIFELWYGYCSYKAKEVLSRAISTLE